MDQGNAQTIATFTGKLLRSERNEAKGLVQLVFREADKNWLCLSSDAQTAELPLGQEYSIEGEFKQIGDRAFIHEPNIAPLAREVKKRRWWIGAAIGAGFLLVACGVVFAADKVYMKPVRHQKTPSTSQASSTDTSGDQSVGDTSPDPADAAGTSTNTPDTTTSTTTLSSTLHTSAPTTGSGVTTTAPAVTTITPYCDSTTDDVPFTVDPPLDDPSKPAGVVTITQAGVDGYTQTCYDAHDVASTTTTPPVDQTSTIGTAPTS